MVGFSQHQSGLANKSVGPAHSHSHYHYLDPRHIIDVCYFFLVLRSTSALAQTTHANKDCTVAGSAQCQSAVVERVRALPIRILIISIVDVFYFFLLNRLRCSYIDLHMYMFS